MDSENHGHGSGTAQGAGVEDAIILPLVLLALIAKNLFQATLSILIHILDYAFPIFLQLIRFPLFTARVIGDGVVALLKAVIAFLPLSGARREEWRELVSRYWSWLRQKISYRAFEEAVHHAFERGMAWVFMRCSRLTPRGALLVIGGAVLWLPISFGAATAIHAALIAQATSLPAWMQLLHPLATILAKSKLLVLPVYPAAWPQAKQHPLVQAILRQYRYITTRRLVQKTGHRYEQLERASAQAAGALGRAADHAGLRRWSNIFLAWLNGVAARTTGASRDGVARMLEVLCRIPLLGSILTNYAKHYGGVEEPHAEAFSKKMSGFFARWSIKFSAQYYEARRQDKG